jgi:hypothetical protein
MWQHVVRKAFSQTDPRELIEAKGLKKQGRDDVVHVSKQPLAKKTRLSWTLDLHQKFLSAVNHLGINSMNLSSVVFLFFAFVLYSIFQ